MPSTRELLGAQEVTGNRADGTRQYGDFPWDEKGFARWRRRRPETPQRAKEVYTGLISSPILTKERGVRRCIEIASMRYDSTMTVEMIERFVKVDPADLLVFSTFTEQAVPIGTCLRLWRDELAVWAELEVEPGTYWPTLDEDPLVHAESVITYKESTPDLVAIVITSMPRGMLAQSLASAFELFKQRAPS